MNVFSYNNYRDLLKDVVAFYINEKGFSFRELALKCNINSSSYLQQIINRKRNITQATGQKIVRGLKFSLMEENYFFLLLELENAGSSEERECIEEKMQRIRDLNGAKLLDDRTIYADWSYGAILELARTQEKMAKADIIEKFSGILRPQKVEDALATMVKKGYLEQENSCFSLPRLHRFTPSGDDKINIDLRAMHDFFLTLAKMRLFLAPKEREYQGLTIAIPSQNFGDLKEKIRNFIREIDEEYSPAADVDKVIHIEIAAFPFFSKS